MAKELTLSSATANRSVVPLSSGGSRTSLHDDPDGVCRQMPGRIVGRTVDLSGRDGFTLTFTGSRAAHPAAKATPTSGTNQGLL